MTTKPKIHMEVDRIKTIVIIDVWIKKDGLKEYHSVVDRRGDPIMKEYLRMMNHLLGY